MLLGSISELCCALLYIHHHNLKLTLLPILEFGDVIYKIASNPLMSKLDGVYHSAICFVTKAPYITHHCDLYALVGWLAPGHL